MHGPQDAEIKGIVCDSRYVRPGYLFVAVPGLKSDGSAYIDQAIARGAVAVMSSRTQWSSRQVSHLSVEHPRLAMALASAAFHGHPSRRLQVVGITGTNGKTTVAFMVRAILKAAGRSPGLIGTVCYEIGSRRIPASRTTPEAPELQAMLGQMVQHGCASVAMEVSSHALDQHRVEGTAFDVAVFTNLSRDHLDYHHDMDRYFEAKSSLFRSLHGDGKTLLAAVNGDDPWSGRLLERMGGSIPRLVYGLGPGHEVRAENLVCDEQGSRFSVCSPWGSAEVRLPLLGRYNVANALAALTACGHLGVDLDMACAGLFSMEPVPGRMQAVPNARGLRVIVDYAHTDDALRNALGILRETTPGQLILVFGCGGDRDRDKRPLMGAAAGELADFSLVTSDNPRSEDPLAIAQEIATGFPAGAAFQVEVDREQAIATALSMARSGDTVLIAGKGHENCQEFANTVIPFEDAEVAARILRSTTP